MMGYFHGWRLGEGRSEIFVFALHLQEADTQLRRYSAPFFCLKIASLMAETNFTLGPTSKTNEFPLFMVIIRPE